MSMHKKATECSEGDYSLWFRTIEFSKTIRVQIFLFVFAHLG